MNKKILAGVLSAICLAVPYGTFADNMDSQQNHNDNPPARFDVSKLNDKQKADLKSQLEKMIRLKKETVEKMVKNGSITKERGDQMIKKLDERLKSVRDGNLEFKRNELPKKDLNEQPNNTDTNQTSPQE